MTRQSIATRIRRLEGRCETGGAQSDELDSLVMEWEQLCALLGEPAGGEKPPRPAVFLRSHHLVRWLHEVSPDRLRELKQAHAAGEPAPPWKN
jgi:hypothetical protein